MVFSWISIFAISLNPSVPSAQCSVNEESSSPLACSQAVNEIPDIKKVESLFKQVESQRHQVKEFKELVCRGPQAEIFGSDGETKFIEIKDSLPGAVVSHLGSRSASEAKSFFHILNEDGSILRYDPESKELLSAKLPKEISQDLSLAQFDSAGRYLESEAAQVDLDELFSKTKKIVDSTPSALGDDTSSQDFRAVRTKNDHNLILFDPKNTEVWNFPVERSVVAQVTGGQPSNREQIGFNRAEAMAVTYSDEGEARIWTSPIRQKLSGVVAGTSVLGSYRDSGVNSGGSTEEFSESQTNFESSEAKAVSIKDQGAESAQLSPQAQVLMGDSANLLERAMNQAAALVGATPSAGEREVLDQELQAQTDEALDRQLLRVQDLILSDKSDSSTDTSFQATHHDDSSGGFEIVDGILRPISPAMVGDSLSNHESEASRASPSSGAGSLPGRLLEDFSKFLWTLPDRKRRRR